MTIFASRFHSFFTGIKFSGILQTYFRSGWAFLIPYLPLYLLYWWRKWPIGPLTAAARNAPVTSEIVPLLHLYWVIHVANIALALIALIHWVNERRTTAGKSEDGLSDRIAPPTLARLLPWILLGLLFAIPRVYLEFPSDPWAHYGRINEWSALDRIDEHSAWKKTTYFFAHSILGQAGTIGQLQRLNFYNTACCLLLSWQYYRLARTLKLGERAALLFVFLTVLTFGNSAFGFCRYYGISSALFAQLGSIALIRIFIDSALARRPPAARELLASIALLALIVGSHIQGTGVAALGLIAVTMYCFVRRRRSSAWWLALGAVILNLSIVQFWPRHPAIETNHIPAGWINSWYGFDLLTLGSPASDRMIAILGAFGCINLGCGLLLLRRNHLVGWLTITPVLALSLPLVAIPFANLLSAENDIVAFHRFLFGIPSGLALIVFATELRLASGSRFRLPDMIAKPLAQASAAVPYGLLVAALAVATILPASRHTYNRFFHSLYRPPADLTLQSSGMYGKEMGRALRTTEKLTTTANGAFIAYALHGFKSDQTWRNFAPSTGLATLAQQLTAGPAGTWRLALFIDPLAVTSSSSQAAQLSGHWNPQFLATEYSGFKEAAHRAGQSGRLVQSGHHALLFVRVP